MLRLLSCLTAEHDWRILMLAAAVCAVGSLVTMRLFARTRRSQGAKRLNWLFLAGVVCGSTVWTTHFVAMLGYAPPVAFAFDPMRTLGSLFLAIGLATGGMLMAASTRESRLIELGGGVIGLGISAMHFAGMSAMQFPARIEWDPAFVAASLMVGIAFGAISMNRIARPVNRFCKYGAALALFCAVISMHFTAMAAVTLVPDPTIGIPESGVSGSTLTVGVLAIMSLVIGTGASSYLIDSYNQEEALRRYRHLALHDAMTGLPNRPHLEHWLQTHLRRGPDETAGAAIIAIDLDRFKDINDAHGHAAGDHVLRTAAERLTQVLETDEILARIGGDEFVAVKTCIFRKTDAENFARRLRETIAMPIEWNDLILSIDASLGVSLFPDDAGEIEALLQRADLAMYRAKQSGSGNIRFYDEQMDEGSRQRAALAIELRHALARNELELFYQPQIDVMSGELVGYEALLRWNHPEHGLVPPSDFIPIAEQTGLIGPIGEWVLREACRAAARWDQPYKIAVNVAPAQFLFADLPAVVRTALAEADLPPARLELEVTESSIISDLQNALHIVRQLKSYGVKIAMDDFGTGYSSLSTLQCFPFDKIKIDRSFVRSVHHNAQASAIVRATIILARSLGIPVLAEGVESQAELDFLRAEGCQEAQGYLFGRPLPLDAVCEGRTLCAAVKEKGRARPTVNVPLAQTA
jgi:diguanylate cyclase (GGDEF)-like protein